MKLRLFTLPNCPKCPAAKELAKEIADSRSDVIIEVLDMSQPENLTTALMLQIASTPSFALDEDVIAVGEVPSLEELNELIDKRKETRCRNRLT